MKVLEDIKAAHIDCLNADRAFTNARIDYEAAKVEGEPSEELEKAMHAAALTTSNTRRARTLAVKALCEEFDFSSYDMDMLK